MTEPVFADGERELLEILLTNDALDAVENGDYRLHLGGNNVWAYDCHGIGIPKDDPDWMNIDYELRWHESLEGAREWLDDG